MVIYILFNYAFGVSAYKAPNGMMICEHRIGQNVEGSGCGPLWIWLIIQTLS